METVVHRAGAHHNPTDFNRISEQEVLADIRYFRRQLAGLPEDENRYNRARRHVYNTLLRQRFQLLAAIRAGRPGDWPVFAPF